MYFIYIDESGNTGIQPSTEQPWYVLGGIIVPADKISDIENAVRTVGFKYFSNRSSDTNFEFHATDIRNGKRNFKDKSVSVRVDIMRDVFKIFEQHSIKTVVSGILKSENLWDLHPHQNAFQFLIEQLEQYLQNIGLNALIIADENPEIEQKIASDFELYKIQGTTRGRSPTKIHRIIDTVHFAQSKNNHLMQLSDIATYYLARLIRICDNTWHITHAEFKSYIDTMSNKDKTDLDFIYRIYDTMVCTKVWPDGYTERLQHFKELMEYRYKNTD